MCADEVRGTSAAAVRKPTAMVWSRMDMGAASEGEFYFR
jgi:hypothetical protein